MSFNEDQENAANWHGSVLLAAPPGSGKTRTLIERIAVIHRRNPQHKVIAVSFTRDSADELQQRIDEKMGAWAKENVAVGTFHSLCKAQLEQAAGKPLDIVDEAERAHLIMSAASELDLDLEEEDAIRLIETEKNALATGKSGGSAMGERLTKRYQQLLLKSQMVDFQDLIGNSLAAMADGTLKALPCQHLLLDELQDIDASQISWALAIAAANDAQIFGVGDDDQSVYGFRMAQGYKGMMQIAEAVNAKQFVLTQNYRSRLEIVQASTLLIERNGHRIAKKIHAANGAGGGISFIRYGSAEKQATAIVDNIETTEGTWGVLARNRQLLLPVQAFLCARNIEHRSVGRTIWEERPVKLFVAALGIAASLNKKLTSHGALFSFIGASDQEIAAIHNSKEFFWTCSKGHMPRAIKLKALMTFRERFPAWKQYASQEDTSDLMIQAVGEWLKESLPPIGKDHREREKALITSAQASLEKMSGTIKKRLLTVTMLNAHKPDARVTLTTFHGAKGLEWDYVWLVSAEDEVIPNARSPIEEERRLFYVAMTRPRTRLILSTRRGVPTCFLHEAFPNDTKQISSGFLHLGESLGVNLAPAEATARQMPWLGIHEQKNADDDGENDAARRSTRFTATFISQ